MILETPEAAELLDYLLKQLDKGKLKRTSQVYIQAIEWQDKKLHHILHLAKNHSYGGLANQPVVPQLIKPLGLELKQHTTRLSDYYQERTKKVSLAKLLSILPSRANYIKDILATL